MARPRQTERVIANVKFPGRFGDGTNARPSFIGRAEIEKKTPQTGKKNNGAAQTKTYILYKIKFSPAAGARNWIWPNARNKLTGRFRIGTEFINPVFILQKKNLFNIIKFTNIYGRAR